MRVSLSWMQIMIPGIKQSALLLSDWIIQFDRSCTELWSSQRPTGKVVSCKSRVYQWRSGVVRWSEFLHTFAPTEAKKLCLAPTSVSASNQPATARTGYSGILCSGGDEAVAGASRRSLSTSATAATPCSSGSVLGYGLLVLEAPITG